MSGRFLTPGVPVDPATLQSQENIANIAAGGREQTAETQGQTQENLANIRAKNVTGSGTLTQYGPGLRGGGPGPVPSGQPSNDVSPNAYAGGVGGETIGVIRGMRTSYAAKGAGPEGEVQGGMLPEYSTQLRAAQEANRMALPGVIAENNQLPISEESKGALNEAARAKYGEYIPPGSEAAAKQHEYRMEENLGKPLSKAQEDEKKRVAGLNAEQFGNMLEQQPHYYTHPAPGQKGNAMESDAIIRPTRAKYEALIANGTMTPEQAMVGFQKEVNPILYHRVAGTQALADQTAQALGVSFNKLYGMPIDQDAGAQLLNARKATPEQMEFVLQTLKGHPNVAMAQKLGLFGKPQAGGTAQVPAGTAAPGTPGLPQVTRPAGGPLNAAPNPLIEGPRQAYRGLQFLKENMLTPQYETFPKEGQ